METLFSFIDNDFLDMLQRLPLTYFDEMNAETSNVYEMYWSPITFIKYGCTKEAMP